MGLLNRLPLTRIKIFIAKVLYRLLMILGVKKDREIVRNGIRYRVDLSEGIDLSLYLFGNFQSHVYKNPNLKIADDAVIFDVGANVGLMTMQFAKTAPRGWVYAFEPTHYALGKLKVNLGLNPELAKRVKIFQTFVSAKTEENSKIEAFASWKVDGKAEGAGVHPVHLGTAKNTDGVGAVTLDDFCEREQIQRLDFIKIDTDGHEFEVFGGAKRTIERFRPSIIFEIGLYVMEEKGIDFGFYEQYFSPMKYKLTNSTNGAEITINNYRQHIPEKGTIDILALPI